MACEALSTLTARPCCLPGAAILVMAWAQLRSNQSSRPGPIWRESTYRRQAMAVSSKEHFKPIRVIQIRIMYTQLEVLFLVDECDTVQAYENKGKTAEAQERRDPHVTAPSSMNRVQQVELISEYNDLKTELTDYLKRFAEEQKVVKAEDIQQFFEDLRSRKRRCVDDMQYYCS